MSAVVADERALRVEGLLALWSDLSMRHVALGAGCACGIGGISLRLEDFELDIAGYLEDAGLRAELPAVRAFFEEWQRREVKDEALHRLLDAVQQEEVDVEVVEWLLPRVEKTLRSFAELHGPRATD
ncbi:MAG TPA: hypothetical protein VLJ86_22275 [Ramlibacter sp.]|nr:hypothetical protein [Ramlibacter sp.]